MSNLLIRQYLPEDLEKCINIHDGAYKKESDRDLFWRWALNTHTKKKPVGLILVEDGALVGFYLNLKSTINIDRSRYPLFQGGPVIAPGKRDFKKLLMLCRATQDFIDSSSGIALGYPNRVNVIYQRYDFAKTLGQITDAVLDYRKLKRPLSLLPFFFKKNDWTLVDPATIGVEIEINGPPAQCFVERDNSDFDWIMKAPGYKFFVLSYGRTGVWALIRKVRTKTQPVGELVFLNFSSSTQVDLQVCIDHLNYKLKKLGFIGLHVRFVGEHLRHALSKNGFNFYQ